MRGPCPRHSARQRGAAPHLRFSTKPNKKREMLFVYLKCCWSDKSLVLSDWAENLASNNLSEDELQQVFTGCYKHEWFVFFLFVLLAVVADELCSGGFGPRLQLPALQPAQLATRIAQIVQEKIETAQKKTKKRKNQSRQPLLHYFEFGVACHADVRVSVERGKRLEL